MESRAKRPPIRATFGARRCRADATDSVYSQRTRAQDFRREMDLPAMQIVFVQDQTKRLNGKRITAASITQNVSPPPGSFDSIAAASSHRGPASSVDDDTVPMIKGRCDPR